MAVTGGTLAWTAPVVHVIGIDAAHAQTSPPPGKARDRRKKPKQSRKRR
jgi:hypothetical protein